MDVDMKSFIGGCLGGFAGIISSYPFDTIKVRIQSQNIKNAQYKGAFDCLRKTIMNESCSALYKGMSSPLIGSMFINAIIFGVEENVRKQLHFNGSKTSSSSDEKFQYKFYVVSGAIAGFTQAVFQSPVELIKIKMQIPDSMYTSTWSCAKHVLLNDGSRSLMRGVGLTMARDVPGITSYFISFELICNSISAKRENLRVSDLLLAGGAAGCLSWIVTYPIDVVKTRYQAEPSYKNVTDCIKRTFHSEGFMGFWRGLSPTLIRAFPNNAAVFATVNLFHRLVDKNQFAYDPYEEIRRFRPSHKDYIYEVYEMHR